MANRPTESQGKQPNRQPPTTAGGDMSEEDQRDMGGKPRPQRAQSTGREEDRGSPDKVEIGDPVPEEDRTIRADETGEDEDLPGRATRGETGEDEDLPDDTSRH